MDFDFSSPTTVAEAISLLSEHGEDAALLAGGTDVLVQLREHHRTARHVVDVKRISELSDLTSDPHDCSLVIGACVSCDRLNASASVRNYFGALSDATSIIGGWQIQTRASVGGNLCNASPAADSIPPLLVHDARCEIAGPGGERYVAADDFCVAPGKNCLEPGELLVSIRLPAPPPRAQSAYLRFIPRNEMDIAVAGAAAYVQLTEDGQSFENIRIALGAVGPTPVIAEAASDFLHGQEINDHNIRRASELAREVAAPISDMRGTREYRLQLCEVLTRRTLTIAVRRARDRLESEVG